jgi:hypothetical protein
MIIAVGVSVVMTPGALTIAIVAVAAIAAALAVVLSI